MQKSHTTFLIARHEDQERGNSAYETLNDYALKLAKDGYEYLKIWDFEKIPSINIILTLENDFNLPVRSKAFVFVQKEIWEKSNFSQFTRIELIDCLPNIGTSTALVSSNEDHFETPLWFINVDSQPLPVYKSHQPRVDGGWLHLFFAEHELSTRDVEKYKKFIEDQKAFFKKKYEGISVSDVPYSKISLLFQKSTARNHKFIMVSSNSKLMLPDGLKVITPQRLDSWKYVGPLRFKSATNSDESTFSGVFFSEFELNETSKAKAKEFVHRVSLFFEESNIFFKFVSYSNLLANIKKHNGNVVNRQIFVITSNPNLIVPKGAELILPDQFNNWDYMEQVD